MFSKKKALSQSSRKINRWTVEQKKTHSERIIRGIKKVLGTVCLNVNQTKDQLSET